MSATTGFFETDNSINRGDGVVWNRLHSEREDICEALLKEYRPGSESSCENNAACKEEAAGTVFWHRELLQSRLRKIDDALDRLMSGSYGSCCKCGRWIEDTKLDFDPAVAFCLECWGHQLNQMSGKRSAVENIEPSNNAVAIETLAPFDTIRVTTQNSDYRIFLLEPQTGRAIVQGGCLVEPADAIVNGSIGAGGIPKIGRIGVGCRLEMMINKGIISTSPVQSVEIDHHFADEHEPVM